ncbi:CPBP family intramembrane glutamic endopeptidase [Maribacter sp. CXY002]|uniref:CPBP family intramembrane glutamic endopeptidase n=1 Tax=Maribacter luteocoastalis TaxID=3407671 RepID=UPI003B6725B9
MYIEQAYKGLSDSWRYFLGIILIFFAWQFIGGIPLVVALILSDDGMSTLASGEMGAMSDALGSNTFFFYMLLTFAIGLFFLFLYVKLVHKQTIKSLTTSRKKVDWKRILFSFFLWGIISVFFIFLDIYLSPEDYKFNFNLYPFLILASIAIFLIPIQTSMEEYFMRGYMMQGLGVLTKNRWFPLVFTSLLFGLMHIFNPEVEKLGYGILIFYVGTGFFLGILTLMDKGLELALGFHAANNLTAALLVTADWTAFKTHSVYTDISDPVLGWDVLVPVFVVFPILLVVFSKKYGWSNWKERLTGRVVSEEEFLNADNT